MEESTIVSDHDIYVAFRVNVRVIAIGALEENFEVAISVVRICVLKSCLDRRIGVLGLCYRSLADQVSSWERGIVMRLVRSFTVLSEQFPECLLMCCKGFPASLVKQVQFLKVCLQQIGSHFRLLKSVVDADSLNIVEQNEA